MTKRRYREDRYINFPIQLLKGFLKGVQGSRSDKKYLHVLQSAAYFAAYKQASKMELGDYGERMDSAVTYLGVDGDLGGEEAYLKGRRISDYVDQMSFGKRPAMTGMKVSVLQRYKYEHVSERQVVCLLGYLALKSIIGNKAYSKTTNQFWLSRMAGEIKAIEADILSDIAPEVSEMNTRRKLERLRNDLIDGWGLSYYGKATRGFYVSFSMPLEDLIFQVEKKRKATKEKARKIRENEAIKKAKDRLNGFDCGRSS
ncbi:hypothetical protein [Cyclobacterium roseum]|uniref:hypothetical protein n=1 Tax=Cyclobacterium roseum TaxID=2666137 RepID=UPI001390BD03|nr:hypothetical protein [Cyclobacterium roseum]